MIEVYDDPNMYEEANNVLMDSYTDLMEAGFNFVDDIDVVEDLIHTIRTYDNKRRRKQIDIMLKNF